ncbi:MAG: hypothetical protein A2169_06400 [Deltaproteobacteria bacterium RBG_13_47_9]|nr:MAG: hypothetical protein A2169_06400 [Deltaproteobacteria bacterium RBG_13_47_9]
MEELNPQLLNFFTSYNKPGIIGIIGTKGTIGMAIREAQKAVTTDGQTSLWSHCFLFGELRYDRRGAGGARSKSPYLFESDLKINVFKSQLRNGAQENWIGKYCREKVENAAVIDFGLSKDRCDDILATALQLVDEQVLYPIHELLGTWWAIITKKQWLPNPLNDPHAMYCSAFVRHCYREAGVDFLGDKISVSNTTPEDIAQAGIKTGAIKIFR